MSFFAFDEPRHLCKKLTKPIPPFLEPGPVDFDHILKKM